MYVPLVQELLYIPFVQAFCTFLLYKPFVRELAYESLLTGASCVQVLRAELRAKPIAEPRTQSRGGRPGGAATDLTMGLRPKAL